MKPGMAGPNPNFSDHKLEWDLRMNHSQWAPSCRDCWVSDRTCCFRAGTDQTQKEGSPGGGLPAVNNPMQLKGTRVGETQVESSSYLEASRFYSPEEN